LATHILQFTFVGIEGFEWPFAYFPTSEVDPVPPVLGFSEYGFNTYASICVGAQCNRSFIVSHFGSIEAAIQGDFTVSNPCTGEPHVFIMDPSVSVGTVLNIFKINIIHQLSQHL